MKSILTLALAYAASSGSGLMWVGRGAQPETRASCVAGHPHPPDTHDPGRVAGLSSNDLLRWRLSHSPPIYQCF